MARTAPGTAGLEDAAETSSLAPAATRAIRILDVLAGARGEPISLADLARAIGAAKSSTSNICQVLEDENMVRRTTTGYVLGRHTVELGGAYLTSFDQISEFYRLCHASTVLSRELVQVAVLHGTDVVYLARHEGRTPLRLTAGAGIGDRYPASLTAIGNALLSTLTPEQVDTLYAGTQLPTLTPRSTHDLAHLHQKLAVTRERGYALDEGEVFPNVVGVAMTVPPRQSGDHMLGVNVSRVIATDPPHLAAEDLDVLLTHLRDLVAGLANPMAVGVGPIWD